MHKEVSELIIDLARTSTRAKASAEDCCCSTPILRTKSLSRHVHAVRYLVVSTSQNLTWSEFSTLLFHDSTLPTPLYRKTCCYCHLCASPGRVTSPCPPQYDLPSVQPPCLPALSPLPPRSNSSHLPPTKAPLRTSPTPALFLRLASLLASPIYKQHRSHSFRPSSSFLLYSFGRACVFGYLKLRA